MTSPASSYRLGSYSIQPTKVDLTYMATTLNPLRAFFMDREAMMMKSNMLLQNITNHLFREAASHPRSLESLIE